MKATELRIGNKLFDYNDRIITINLIDYPIQVKEYFVGCKENHSRYTIDDIKPIPLTEQRLKDFGFRKYSSTQYDKDDFWSIKYEGERGFYSNQLECYIKYVHQLQNLYFALTDKELIKS